MSCFTSPSWPLLMCFELPEAPTPSLPGCDEQEGANSILCLEAATSTVACMRCYADVHAHTRHPTGSHPSSAHVASENAPCTPGCGVGAVSTAVGVGARELRGRRHRRGGEGGGGARLPVGCPVYACTSAQHRIHATVEVAASRHNVLFVPSLARRIRAMKEWALLVAQSTLITAKKVR